VATDSLLSKAKKKAFADLESSDVLCANCAAAKVHRKHPNKHNVTGSDGRHTGDAAGPMPKSRLGNTYLFVWIDGSCGWIEDGYGRHKSDVKHWTQINAPVWDEESPIGFKRTKTDRGGEYTAIDFENWFKRNGIKHDLTAPNSSSGPAEGALKTIKQNARAQLNWAFGVDGVTLEDSSTGDYLWDESCAYAITVTHMIPSSSPHLNGKSPWEIRKGEPPPYHKLHNWGSLCYAHKPQFSTFGNPGRPCAFMGLARKGAGARFYDGLTNTIFHSTSFWCIEDVSYFSIKAKSLAKPIDQQDCFNPMCKQNAGGEHHPECPYYHAHFDNDELPVEEEKLVEEMSEPRKRAQRQMFDPEAFDAAWEHDHEKAYLANPDWIDDIEQVCVANQRVVGEDRYTKTGRLKTGLLPKDDKEALKSEDRVFWREAMGKEKDMLGKLNTFAEVPRTETPKYGKLMSARWVFAIKRFADGSLEKYKGRLVAKGYLQRLAWNAETYTPTPSLVAVRMIIALTLEMGWQFSQYDISSAFLNSYITGKPIYMEPPSFFNAKPGYVFRLKKFLYGLKEACLAWHKNISSKFTANNFKPTTADPCVAVHRDKAGDVDGINVIHVDDGFVTGKSTIINRFIKMLKSYYTVNTLDGSKHSYIGMKVEFSDDGQTAELSQTAFIDELLDDFGMSDCRSNKTPSRTKPLEYGPLTDDEIAFMADKKEKFHSLVGSFQYLQRGTRPDISEAATTLSTCVNNPRKNDWDAGQQVLRYLKGTRTYGLRYTKSKDGVQQSVAWSDSNHGGFAGEHGGIGRHSRTGVAINFAGAAVDWCSNKQTCVSRSSAEAEIVALDTATKKVLYVRKLERAMDIGTKRDGVQHPSVIHEDNDAAIAISTKNIRSKRTKHIDIQYFAVTDDIDKGRIQVDPVDTDENIADIFTKPLGRVKFEKFRAMLGVVDVCK
jgi:hypothetical protein